MISLFVSFYVERYWNKKSFRWIKNYVILIMRMYQRNDICNLLKEILFENIHIYSLPVYSRLKHFLITSMSFNKHRKSLKFKTFKSITK